MRMHCITIIFFFIIFFFFFVLFLTQLSNINFEMGSSSDANTVLGKRKSTIEKTHDDNMMTASAKRKLASIYKKITEYVTLTGSQVGFLAFSPSGKPYTFGHPSMMEVVNRYLNQNPTHHKANEVEIQVKEEEERTKKADDWWNRSVEDASKEELAEMAAAYTELRAKVEKRAIELRMMDEATMKAIE